MTPETLRDYEAELRARQRIVRENEARIAELQHMLKTFRRAA